MNLPSKIKFGNIGTLLTAVDENGEVFQTLTVETSGNNIVEVKPTHGLIFDSADELKELYEYWKELDTSLSE